MGFFANVLNWLRGRVRPQGYSPPYLKEKNPETWEPCSEESSSEVMLAAYYDKDLFERARTQWQFGDWESLSRIERESLYHHPQRASLALLAAAGHQQTGNTESTREFTRLAKEWGASRKMISQVLIAGVYNTLGKASALCGHQQRAIGHFEESFRIARDGGDVRLLTQARAGQIWIKSGLPNSDIDITNIKYQLPKVGNLEKGLGPQVKKDFFRKRTAIITGIPRSGTSLFSVMLNKIDGVVCLNEILYNVDTLDKDFEELRYKLVSGLPIANKYNDKGELTTDTMFPTSVKEVALPKQKKDVVICSKVNYPYLSSLERIMELKIPVFVIVRDPVYTVASWSSEKANEIPEAQVGPAPLRQHKRWDNFGFKTGDPLKRRVEIWNHMAGIIIKNISDLKLVNYEVLIQSPEKAMAEFMALMGKPYHEGWNIEFDGNDPTRFQDEGIDLKKIEILVKEIASNRFFLGYK
jgi:hypothetical protein